MRLWHLLLLTALACEPQPPPGAQAPPEGEPGQRDTLVIAWADDVESLISVVPQTTADGEVTWLTNPLVADVGFDCGLSYHPWIAREWSFSDDGLSLSVALRDDLRWSDGTPFTARDVAFTYQLAGDPAVGSPRAAFLERMDPAARPRVVDDHHLEFVFTTAYDPATMLAHAFGLEIMPEHVLKDAERGTLKGHAFNQQPVVYGPWHVASRTAGQTVVLEPNPAYTGPEDWTPKLRRVVLKILPEAATRLLELEAGTVDMVTGLEVEDAQRLAVEKPELQLLRRGWRAMEYVGWNTIDGGRYQGLVEAAGEGVSVDPAGAGPHPVLGDPAVRRALTMSIDVDRAMKDLLGSPSGEEVYAKRAVGTISPALCQHHASDIEPLPHDPATARTLLAEAGWIDGDGDGVLDKDGLSLSLELLVSAGNPRRERIALLVQDALKRQGVEVRITTLDFNAYLDRAVRKDFDALVGGWSASLFVDPTSKWHSGPEHVYNFVSYADEQADALIAQGLSQPDPAQAAETWRELQRSIYEDQPYTFLWWVDEIVAVDGRFHDVQVHPSSPLYHLHEWWVPAGEVKYPH